MRTRYLPTVWIRRRKARHSKIIVRQRYHVKSRIPHITDGRSKRAILLDKERSSKHRLKLTRENYLKWKRNKGGCDIIGYDTILHRVRLLRRIHKRKKAFKARREQPASFRVLPFDQIRRHRERRYYETMKGRSGLTGVEEHNLLAYVKNTIGGDNVDKVDLMALIDPTLTYNENKTIIQKAISPTFKDMWEHQIMFER